ncbi:MAG TPA: hypothetical protein VJC13_03360 [Candidatus Paceibacterota bacterium]
MANKKYRKMKKVLLASASTGIVAGMFLLGSAPVLAENVDSFVPAYTQNTLNTGMHMMHRWNSTTKVNALANRLGLDPVAVNSELKSGKTLKQILQENGIVPDQLHKVITTKKASNKMWKNHRSSL